MSTHGQKRLYNRLNQPFSLAMAGGFAKDGAVQDHIDTSVEDGIKRARDQLPCGESLERCAECNAVIPQACRLAVPGVRLCIRRQEERDKNTKASAATTAAEARTASCGEE
jgi:RNA polymerase-binding transcription factor DksA